MARIYNDRNDNPLANLAQSYLDERHRRRQQQLTRDELQMSQDLKANEVYKTVNRNKQGDYSGLASNLEDRQRDTPILKKKLPEMFSTPVEPIAMPGQDRTTISDEEYIKQRDLKDAALKSMAQNAQPPAPLAQAPQQNKLLDRTTGAVISPGESPRVPKGLPEVSIQERAQLLPLLKNPGDSITRDIPGKAAIPGQPPEKKILTPPAKFDEDLGVNGSPSPEFNPSDIMLSKLRDASAESVKSSLKRIPPSQMNSLVLQYADKVRGGFPIGQAIQDIQDQKGSPLSKEEYGLLTGESRQGAIEGRQAKGFGQQDKKTIQGSLSKARSELNTESRESIKALAAATALKTLASDPNSQGFQEAMKLMASTASGSRGAQSDRDVEAFSGVPQWSTQMRQAISTYVKGKGLLPENKENFIRLATAFENAQKAKLEAMLEDQVTSTMAEVQDYGIPEERIRKALSIDNQLNAALKAFTVPPKKIGTTNPDPRNRSDKGISNEEMLKLEAIVTQKLRQIDAMDKNASEKRALKQKVYDLYKKKSGGVEYLRKDGSAVP